MTFEELMEKDALREALSWYCHTLDSRRLDDWCKTFTADGVWDGGPIGKFTGWDELKGFAESLPQIFGPRPLRHSVSNFIINVNRNEAHVLAYLDLMQVGEDGGGPRLLDAATYDVDYVKENGRWLIKYMRIIHKA
jgi:hypothetical protein